VFPSLDIYFLLSHWTFSILLSLHPRVCPHALVILDIFIFTSMFAIYCHVGLSLAKAVLLLFFLSIPFLLTRLIAYMFSCIRPLSYKYHHPASLNSRQLWPKFSLLLFVCILGQLWPNLHLISISICVSSSLSPSTLTLAIDTWHHHLWTHAFHLIHNLLTSTFRPLHWHMPMAVGITTHIYHLPATLIYVPFRNIAQVLFPLAHLGTLTLLRFNGLKTWLV
jgi:hypothetical protein